MHIIYLDPNSLLMIVLMHFSGILLLCSFEQMQGIL